MAVYEEPRRINASTHTVTVAGKERATVTAVEDVDSFNENEVIFLTSVGMMTVVGEDLHIAKLDLGEGLLVIEGMIQALDYADHEEMRMHKPGLLARMFK